MQNELLHVSQLQRGKSPVTLCQSCHKLREIVCRSLPSSPSASLCLPAHVCVWWGGKYVCGRGVAGFVAGANWQRSLRAVRVGVYLRRTATFSALPLSLSLSLAVTLPLSVSCSPSLPPSLSCALSSFHLQQSESFKVHAALSNAKKSSAEAKRGNGKGKGRERSIGSALGRGMGLANTGYPSRVYTVFSRLLLPVACRQFRSQTLSLALWLFGSLVLSPAGKVEHGAHVRNNYSANTCTAYAIASRSSHLQLRLKAHGSGSGSVSRCRPFLCLTPPH